MRECTESASNLMHSLFYLFPFPSHPLSQITRFPLRQFQSTHHPSSFFVMPRRSVSVKEQCDWSNYVDGDPATSNLMGTKYCVRHRAVREHRRHIGEAVDALESLVCLFSTHKSGVLRLTDASFIFYHRKPKGSNCQGSRIHIQTVTSLAVIL